MSKECKPGWGDRFVNGGCAIAFVIVMLAVAVGVAVRVFKFVTTELN